MALLVSGLRGLEELILNALFPRTCVVCGKEGGWACAECSLVLEDIQIYRTVAARGEEILSFFNFDQPLVRELLHNLKYGNIWEIAPVLVDLINSQYSNLKLKSYCANAVLIPVPSSLVTLKSRGYSQAEELAKALGRGLDLPVWSSALTKTSQKGSQVGRNAQERAESAARAFAWKKGEIPEKLKRRPWILVDDLLTTGSTVNACLDVLRTRTTIPLKALTLAYTPK